MTTYLISRLSAVGDVILTMPMATALRRSDPSARIIWVAEPGPATLLEGHAAVDRCVIVPKGWLGRPSRVWALRRALRKECVDIAFDPQSLTKSAMAAYLSGATERVAFARPVGRELAPLMATLRVRARHRHIVDRQREMLRAVDLIPGPVVFDVPRDAPSEEVVAEWFRQAGPQGAFFVINPGAAWPSKRWPPERFAELSRRLIRETDTACVVVWGNDAEREWAAAIAEEAGSGCHVAPPTNLPQLAALLRRAAFAISGDSGPLHLAAAVGTPCIGLYGPTLPECVGPYGPAHEAIQVYYQDGNARTRRAAHNDAMRAITVDMVCRAAHRLKTRRAKPAA